MRRRKPGKYSLLFAQLPQIDDIANNIYEYYENELTKRKLIFSEISIVWDIITLIPGIIGAIVFTYSFIEYSLNAFLLSLALIFLSVLGEYLVVWWVIKYKYKKRISFYSVRKTNLKYQEIRIAFARHKLFEEYSIQSSDLVDLADILETKANSKGNNMIYLVSVLGIFFLPLWSEYVSWTYSRVDVNEPISNAMQTMINLIPLALIGVIFVCIVKFFSTSIFFSERNKLMRLASIMKLLSFEKRANDTSSNM